MNIANLDIWTGWALCAASENMRQMPVWVAKAVHPDCDKPTHAWAMLVGLQRERIALRTGERLAKEVMGYPGATADQAEQYLDRQSMPWSMDLAWGSLGGDW